MKKICTMLLISILLISGCTKEESLPLVNSNESNELVDHSQIISSFYDLKDSDMSTSMLGDFLTNNIDKLDVNDTSIIVSEIIKYATFEKTLLSGKVYTYSDITSVYASQFNYVWNINTIDTLEDSELKTFLNELASSYYKISTHKNYIDVDIDYNRLAQISNLSDELKLFIDINKAKRTILLDASLKGEFDYKSLRDNIIKLESFMSNYPNSELLYEAESLYKSLINMYFIGSDGLDPFDYENKKFKLSFFDTLTDTSLNYPSTMFSEICSKFLIQIDNINEYKTVDYVSLVSNYRKMGLKNKNTITSLVSEKSNNSNVSYPQFSNFKNTEMQNALNDKIKTEIEIIKTHLEWKNDPNTKYNISYFVNYGSYKYISIQLTGSSYNRENKENSTFQTNLNFDIQTGERLKLSDLFDKSFDEYNNTLSKLIRSSGDIPSSNLSSFDKLTKEPDFLISDQSLVLYFKKGEYNFDDKYPVYVYINQNKLKSLLDFRSIYK